MNGEILRLVDSIHRDKDIDKEIVFVGLEEALLSAARKHFGMREELRVEIDRETGNITAMDGEDPISPEELGRIAAQTARQVIIQKIREAEGDAIFRDFSGRVRDIVTGSVLRVEGSTVIVNLGRAEGILPRREQLPDERYHVGDRIRVIILDVRRASKGNRVRILLSRTHPDLVKRLFELEVPEIGERIIEIRGLAREPGYRTKIAVSSADMRVDCVGACVGVRGMRIKNIVAELSSEKIDIVRWDDASEVMIANSLKPAEVMHISLYSETRAARVVVADDQLSLSIGKRGQNVRLAARLTQWDIDIMTEEEQHERARQVSETVGNLSQAGEEVAERLLRVGYFSLNRIVNADHEIMAEAAQIEEELALQIITASVRARDEYAAAAAAEAEARRAAEAAEAEARRAAEAAEAAEAEAQRAAEEAEAAAQQEAAAAAETEPEPEPSEASVAEARDGDAGEPPVSQEPEDSEPAPEDEAEEPDAPPDVEDAVAPEDEPEPT